MNKNDKFNRLFTVAKILIVALLVSIVPSSCMLDRDPFMVPITDQDIRFLKKCMGEDGTVHVAMRDSFRKQLEEIVKDDGSRTLVSGHQYPFPPTISQDRSELRLQCYNFMWNGAYDAEDPDFF